MSKPERLETLADAIVPEAIEWIAELRKYRTYQGKDPEYFRKARMAIGAIGNAVRLCATIENNHANELVARRLAALGEGGAGAALNRRIEAGADPAVPHAEQ